MSSSLLLAAASAAHGFDVDAATRAYLDTLQGAARAKSDAYFEGGYWLPLWGALVIDPRLLAHAAFPLVGGMERLGAAGSPSVAGCSRRSMPCPSPLSARC